MPTDRWHRLEEIFTAAVEQPVELRGDFLERHCGPDAGLRDEIASLLTAAEQSGAFLSAPALEAFARQISREGWSAQPGDRIGAYTLERRIGAGGMGEVWRARDVRLGRDVAIKLLLPPPSHAAGRGLALEAEARAAGALNHSNVLTVHDVGEHGGAPYLVTECLDGESLRVRLTGGALSVDAALDVALQVARGLGAAHTRGIVHRDLKPENIFLATDGRVKILDFGLATRHDSAAPSGVRLVEHPLDTMSSLGAGTAGYMAPEQVRGDLVDGRADLFALGVVLYEMLAGHRPWNEDSTLATLEAVKTRPAPDLSDVNPAIPPALPPIVRRCLAKSPDDRFATSAEVVSALDSVVRARNLPPPPTLRAFLGRPVVMVCVLLVILAMAAGGWRWQVVASRDRWASRVAAPEARRLFNHGDFAEAFVLAREALGQLPDDPELRQLWLDVSLPQTVITDPPGADVAFSPYRSTSPTWFALGRTPLTGVRLPRGQIRVRVSKAGFQGIEAARSPPGLRYRLDPVDAVPPGMVRVVGGRESGGLGFVGEIDDFWIDRFEVTNRQFKAFVDHGGYRRRDYWRQPFIESGRPVPWEDAVERFRDGTGRPGPATWTAGTYPDGQAEFPVGGVSWYEAAAYAAFVGKSLPTIHHWYRAANLGRFSDILMVSNFNGTGPAAVGSHQGLGPFGTYDMAGNVKEWCWTETDGRRALLGGAWDEPRYAFANLDARGPFGRAPNYGFRLAQYRGPQPAEVTAPVRMETLVRDGRTLKPVGDDIFEVYRRQYAYDRVPLNAVVEATDEREAWVRATVAYDAAYGGERVRAHLFLPKNGSPPYQTIIFFPAGDAFRLHSSRDMSLAWVDFIIRSGRALLYPVYQGTYERITADPTGPNTARDLRIAWSRDLGRAIDYLETRPDIDRTRLAFYGVSDGADAGVILTALEPRLRASILQGTGIWGDGMPENDAFNYAPRVRVPTLMLNGRYDFGAPLETAQRPLFDLLGSRVDQKQHTVFETGHALPMEQVARATLPWLDRHLGTVGQNSTGSIGRPADSRPR